LKEQMMKLKLVIKHDYDEHVNLDFKLNII
jgi:hypothetical protein